MGRSEIRAVSTALFNNTWRLEVCAAIGRLQGKPVCAKSVATEAAVDYNRAHEQFARLVEHRLLIPDIDPAARQKDHRAVDISFWAACAKLVDELEAIDSLG